MLGKAVTDAVEKAKVLTQAASVTLKSIQSIDYSWGEIDLELRMQPKIMTDGCAAPMCSDEAYDININPDDIETSDTVTVVWEIE